MRLARLLVTVGAARDSAQDPERVARSDGLGARGTTFRVVHEYVSSAALALEDGEDVIIRNLHDSRSL